MVEVQKRRLRPAKEPRKIERPVKEKKNHLGRTPSVIFYPLRVFKFLVPSYFKNSFKELKQVTWPTRRETLKLTFAVFMFATIFGIFITLVDYGLNSVFKRILLK